MVECHELGFSTSWQWIEVHGSYLSQGYELGFSTWHWSEGSNLRQGHEGDKHCRYHITHACIHIHCMNLNYLIEYKQPSWHYRKDNYQNPAYKHTKCIRPWTDVQRTIQLRLFSAECVTLRPYFCRHFWIYTEFCFKYFLVGIFFVRDGTRLKDANSQLAAIITIIRRYELRCES